MLQDQQIPGGREHAGPEIFQFLKSGMAISRDIKVKCMQTE
jgi:hypothetical protein